MRSLLSLGSLRALLVMALAAGAATTACSAETDAGLGDESDLTSVTARSRTLEFVGTVYLAPGSSDEQILSAVRSQAQTAFGPLRTSEMAVNKRELRDIDTSTFVKRVVKIVDVAGGGGTEEKLEVKYTYKDDAVVGVSYANRTSAPLAVMNPSYRNQLDRVMKECTTNDEHAREFRSSAWYVFEPSLPQCQQAIRAEQQKVEADRASLGVAAKDSVAKTEAERLYLPITAQLGADKTNRGDSFPDYHRLYEGGVKANKLVISLVYGLIDKGPKATASGDHNWGELMTNIGELIDAQGGGFEAVPGGPDDVDLSRFGLSSGKVVDKPSFGELVKLKTGGSSLGAAHNLSYDEKAELQKLFAERIFHKWITVEKKVKVAIGDEAPRDFGIQLLVHWGVTGIAPHKYALKNSDVFLYNGHSSIGYGPLDPKNFTAADFPSTYQIMWVDGCVSYNYYHSDYIPLKEGGTKNLDLVTNGLEAPAWRSGHAMAQFLARMLDGTGASYRDLLLAARDTEALRVVDGELDNEFTPAKFPIRVTSR